VFGLTAGQACRSGSRFKMVCAEESSALLDPTPDTAKSGVRGQKGPASYRDRSRSSIGRLKVNKNNSF
jgi:hypothetical protein